MAISLLQDAQQRNLAAALAGIKRDDLALDRTLSMSPPMSANTSSSSAAVSMYPGLQQAAAASAFGMLSPTQLMAANRQAAAAFMAAQLPMSQLASTLFPHHPALAFAGSWAAAAATANAPHMPLAAGPHTPHSPPASPHSPISVTHAHATHAQHMDSTPLSGKHSLAAISPTACSQGELPAKKSRKAASLGVGAKKDLNSPPIEISMSVSDLYQTPGGGPMSPPSSGSSPNSIHESSAGGGGVASVAAKDAAAAARDKSFTCKICSRSFGYKHVLQNHERTHTGEKPFECPECHKRFTRDHHLKTHMRLHTGEKPYHCSHCDRQFVQVANLRRHLRVHTGERPYTCEICDGKFSDSNQLKSHMLVHNGEKPFDCDRCHMKFRRRHHLLNHKCGGLQSPPTPALSPAMSGEYAMCDQKSAMGSSYGSEESMDIGIHASSSSLENNATTSATAAIDADEAPLDLSEDGGSSSTTEGARLRKPHDIRRVFRLPPQIMHVATAMPEQTEPEDLSMHSPRMSLLTTTTTTTSTQLESPESMHHDDIDLDELDDAAALYMRQQHLASMRCGGGGVGGAGMQME